VCEQFLKILRIADGTAAQAFIAFTETRIVKTHALGQSPEDVGVGSRLPHWRNGRPVEQHIGMAIAGVDVPMLELRGGGQDEIGVVCRVGLKVLEHHSEQVRAAKALHHLARLGRHRHRVAVVDDQGFDLRTKVGRRRAQQIIPDGGHVDGARAAIAE